MKTKISRISRQDFYVQAALLAAQRGSCPRAQVGCVLIDDRFRIVGIGYNSSHAGSKDCLTEGCLIVDGHCIRTVHAEQAAILNLPKFYDSLVCYTTTQPCLNCYKLLAAARVKEIFYLNSYPDKGRDALYIDVPIKMTHIILKKGKRK